MDLLMGSSCFFLVRTGRSVLALLPKTVWLSPLELVLCYDTDSRSFSGIKERNHGFGLIELPSCLRGIFEVIEETGYSTS